MGAIVLLIPLIGFIIIVATVGPLPPQLVPGMVLMGIIGFVPGATYLVLGWWYRQKAKQEEEVMRPKLKDYAVIFLQLSPGVVLSSVGILMPKLAPDLVDALGPDYLNWFLLALGTLTSVIVVRRVRDKA
ncbi:hypothetical protein D7003_07410 [Arthrobacter oryzae]|uniref:Uncharacterized protein n=2 Tax=Arthrobacter oryzae TaxID=409290 RepID=A0A3N0C3R9_9MICC|nr:hypothetical protein D7003_07410 [Arthrobacter oryzae]